MDEYPRTQPDGSLTPPPRVPPTALATAAPLPPPQPSRPTRRWELQAIVDRVFDRLDTIADGIANAVGLR